MWIPLGWVGYAASPTHTFSPSIHDVLYWLQLGYSRFFSLAGLFCFSELSPYLGFLLSVGRCSGEISSGLVHFTSHRYSLAHSTSQVSPHTISNTSTCTRFVQRISPDRAGAISCFFLLHNQHTPAHQIAMHCTNISITSSLSTILACDFSDSANFNLGCGLSLLGHAD